MTTAQIIWLIFLIPLFLIYGIMEFDRGWKILRYGKVSLNVSVLIRIWLVKVLKGEKKAKQFQMNIQSNTYQMRLLGIYSLLGGLICVLVGIFWLIAIIRLF